MAEIRRGLRFLKYATRRFLFAKSAARRFGGSYKSMEIWYTGWLVENSKQIIERVVHVVFYTCLFTRHSYVMFVGACMLAYNKIIVNLID